MTARSRPDFTALAPLCLEAKCYLWEKVTINKLPRKLCINFTTAVYRTTHSPDRTCGMRDTLVSCERRNVIKHSAPSD